jgi:hypothetical protein
LGTFPAAPTGFLLGRNRIGVYLKLCIVHKRIAVDAPVRLNLRPGAAPFRLRGPGCAADGFVVVRETCAAAPCLRQHLAIEPARF